MVERIRTTRNSRRLMKGAVTLFALLTFFGAGAAAAHVSFTSNWSSPVPWYSSGNCSVRAEGGYTSGAPGNSYAYAITDGGYCDKIGVSLGYRTVSAHNGSGGHYYYGSGWKYTTSTYVSWWKGPPYWGWGVTPTVSSHYIKENGSATIKTHVY